MEDWEVVTVLLENGAILEEFVLFSDEIHLQKKKSSIRVESLLEQIKKGILYKGVVFMIVSRKNYIPFVVKSLPETSVSGQWFGEPTHRSIYDLNITNTQITTINTKIYLTLFLKLKKGYLIYLRKY